MIFVYNLIGKGVKQKQIERISDSHDILLVHCNCKHFDNILNWKNTYTSFLHYIRIYSEGKFLIITWILY